MTLTVEALENAIAAAIQSQLRPFISPNLSVAVTLRHPKRKVKRTAPSTCWDPAGGDFLEVRFELADSRALAGAAPVKAAPYSAAAPSPEVPQLGTEAGADTHPERLIRALARAENSPTHRFVSLKWFRDQALAQEGIYHPEARTLLNSAIHSGAVRTRKEANPHNAEHPVTAIYLDRNHPSVQAALSQAEGRFTFRPIEVRGEPVSASLIRDRQ